MQPERTHRIDSGDNAVGLPPPIAGRLRWLFLIFTALVFTVFGRLVALEMREGGEYRAVAAQPTVQKHSIVAQRGRILAGDGTVLAYDEPLDALAVNYRWLEEPANPRWLRRMARSRLKPTQRRSPQLVAQEEQKFLEERVDLAQRLAILCGLTDDQWQTNAAKIQRKVEAIAAGVNSRHAARAESELQNKSDGQPANADSGWVATIGRSIVDALFAVDHPPAETPITVADEMSEHIVCEGLPAEAVAEIQSHPVLYPGVKIVRMYRRVYPQGNLAAHVVGYVGSVAADETKAVDAEGNTATSQQWIGRSGVERQYETVLHAQPGLVEEQIDIRGVVQSSKMVREPADGRDVILSIDPPLQKSMQSLIDQALARRLHGDDEKLDAAVGAAAIAIDVKSGAILAAASAPRFDPNCFVEAGSKDVAGWLVDPARPLFDRAVQMALPPGSVFKIVSAAAIVAAGIDPRAAVDCQGYLHQPDALRCAIFRRTGAGHGPVTLIDALARSCNVYFFHHAEQLGATPILDWADRFGLGQKTGVDLPGESTGHLAKTGEMDAPDRKPPPIDPLFTAIGQGKTTATPLQIVRVAATIANGGLLVTPHFARQIATLPHAGEAAKTQELGFDPPRQIAGLDQKTVSAIRDGMRQAVADEQGTAHATVELPGVSIAGKTGTAETGGGKPEHAWFVGYAPAEQPRVAFVVVIEHAGNADIAAGPVAQHLVERMAQLGYFDRTNRLR